MHRRGGSSYGGSSSGGYNRGGGGDGRRDGGHGGGQYHEESGGRYNPGGRTRPRIPPSRQEFDERFQSRGEQWGAPSGMSDVQRELPQRLITQRPSLPPQMQAFRDASQHFDMQTNCPSPLLPATQVQRKDGLCSVYTLKVKPGRKAYRYDIDIWRLPMQKHNGRMDGGKNLAKGADDGQKALHRNLCFELMTIAFQKTNRFGMPSEHELVYDCKSTMYTSIPLRDFDINGGQVIDIGGQDINDYVRTYCGENGDIKFTVTVQRNSAVPELDLNDYSRYQSGETVFNEDRSLRTFFEMAISQYAINNEMLVQIGIGKLFEYPQGEPRRVGNGIILRSGLVKGVRIIRNNGIVKNGARGNGNGGPKAAVVLDAKTSAFFEPQPLIMTVLNILPRRNKTKLSMNDYSQADWEKVNRLIEDVRVEVDYRKTRTFELGKLTTKPIAELFLDVERPGGGGLEKISVPEYFRRRYNIQLEHTDFPGIHPNNPVPKGQKLEVFPLEVLNVMEDQRVPNSKMEPALTDKLLNANSLFPKQRMDEIQRRADEQLGLFYDRNPVLSAFGITIDKKSNRIMICLRSLPRIRFANRTVDPTKNKGDWRDGGGYMETNGLGNWKILCSDENRRIVEEFADRLMQIGHDKGVQMALPEIKSFRCSENNDRDWANTFEQCAEQNVQFIMLIDPKRQDTHGLLKMYEAIYKPMVTQHVTIEKARDVCQKNQRQTLGNILNKLNMKNFGLNYAPVIENCGRRFALENGNVLAIGYDVSHPGSMRGEDRRRLLAQASKNKNTTELELTSLEPSVVGICANMAANPHSFVGDYFYQESRREALDMGQLAQRIVWILTNLERNRPRQCRPEYVFILRDGLSEGQFAMACKEELAAIRMGCAAYDETYKPKFVFIVGTKRHFKKFFIDGGIQGGQLVIENLPPGSVIQDQVVRADLTEFYLQPHNPLKGTGKPIEYGLLENEANANMDEIQAFLMSLCYSHQIVNMAISLPAPVYQADELAKRGKNNFMAFRKFYPGHVPMMPVRSGISVQMVDYHALTEKLSYWGNGTEILAHRFTA